MTRVIFLPKVQILQPLFRVFTTAHFLSVYNNCKNTQTQFDYVSRQNSQKKYTKLRISVIFVLKLLTAAAGVLSLKLRYETLL